MSYQNALGPIVGAAINKLIDLGAESSNAKAARVTVEIVPEGQPNAGKLRANPNPQELSRLGDVGGEAAADALRRMPGFENRLTATVDELSKHLNVHVHAQSRLTNGNVGYVPTRREFTLFQEHFATLGLDCVIGDPARCEYAGGRLTLDGGPIGATSAVHERARC